MPGGNSPKKPAYAHDTSTVLVNFYPAKGMSSPACTVFVAEQLEVGQHSREHEEQDMRRCQFSQADLENMIRVGTITDDSTIAAYMLYLLSGPKRILE